jgi:hypothetical protein
MHAKNCMEKDIIIVNVKVEYLNELSVSFFLKKLSVRLNVDIIIDRCNQGNIKMCDIDFLFNY